MLRRLAVGASACVLLAYLGAMALLYKSQARLLYFPRPLQLEPTAEVFKWRSGELELRGWAINPGQPRALLYFGGNAEAVEHDVFEFRDLIPGTSVYLLPYRGYSGNPGTASEAALFADALAAYDAIAARHAGVDVMGRSLGSGVAVHLAAERLVGRLLLVTPYDSIVNVAQQKYPLFPISLLAKDRYDSAARAPQVKSQVLLLTASSDQIIPAMHSEALARSFDAAPLVCAFAGRGHNDISQAPEFWPSVRRFLVGEVPCAPGANPGSTGQRNGSG
ncbi:alpha/beta hydrolase [Arenimonas sp.]|uniref:alpha/beta hydrolase n=1 Tax=Arenimonas sp. TaxID=1872635 RepID=UPI0039E45051